MHVRIFGTPEAARAMESICHLIRLRRRARAEPWTVETCAPDQFGVGAMSVADIHVYLGVPLRLAIPWARLNVLAMPAGAWPEAWNWSLAPVAEGGMDLFVLSEPESVDAATERTRRFILPTGRKERTDAWQRILERPRRATGTIPKSLDAAPGTAPPKVAIVTLTHRRREWWRNMVQNVLKQSWPVSRMEWIIVDDSPPDERMTEVIEELQGRAAALRVSYVELEGDGWTIGEKRNRGCAAASADVSVFVMMDDDDHYPGDSVSVRASWLTTGASIVYCSVLPMYDCRRYVSAINVPPLWESPAARVSEASLAFTREAWTTRPFPEVSVAEGEGFVAGREAQCVEIPPAGVIVSIIHGGNSTSRRVPASQEPNGCHYGFSDEYFAYLSRIGTTPKAESDSSRDSPAQQIPASE